MHLTETRPLPRGRHSLSREDVAASQRTRLEAGIVELVAHQGLAATTVQHIVAAAAVSRQTFYEHYRSKDVCFDAAVDAFAQQVVAATRSEVDPDAAPLDRLEQALTVMFGLLAQEPALTHCLLFETTGGPTHPRVVLRETYAEHLAEVLGPDDAFGLRGFTAMIRQLVEEEVRSGHCAELPALATDVVALIRRHVGARV